MNPIDQRPRSRKAAAMQPKDPLNGLRLHAANITAYNNDTTEADAAMLLIAAIGETDDNAATVTLPRKALCSLLDDLAQRLCAYRYHLGNLCAAVQRTATPAVVACNEVQP